MRTAEQTYYKLLIACNPEASIAVHSIISLKQLTDRFDPHNEPLNMFKAVFGDNAWKYSNKASVFGRVDGCAESFVRDAYAGHMCIYRDCKAFLHDFAKQKDKYGTIIDGVTNNFSKRIYDPTITKTTDIKITDIKITDKIIRNVKELAESWKSLFIDESEKRGLYRSSVSSEICDSAIEILDAVDDMFQEKMTKDCFSKGIVALGFFSICFLTFTDSAYQHCKKDYPAPFQTIQNGLISLLEAVKTFLCPKQSERKNFSMQEHTKTAESTSNAGKPKTPPSGQSVPRIRRGFIVSGYFDELFFEMKSIDNREGLKDLIKREVEKYVDALSLREFIDDGDIQCMCYSLHIDVDTRYAPIIALLARCAAVLAAILEFRSSEANKLYDESAVLKFRGLEANKLYNEWYNEAVREAEQIQNDEKER